MAENAVPKLLSGYWENNKRIISFEHTESAHIVLKLFYGWYYDSTAESFLENAKELRPRNAATSPQPEVLQISFEELIPETETSGAWNIVIYYSDIKKSLSIPVAVFNKKLYLDFYLLKTEDTYRVFEKASNVQEITVNLPLVDKEVYSYLDTGNTLYKIRYWETDMDFDKESKAFIQEGNTLYQVQKHLKIGDNIYTCVSGRGVKIRNIEKIPYTIDNFIFSSDKRICVTEKPYVVAMDLETFSIFDNINKANSRKAPPPSPVFPPSDLDFHYDTIEELRKYMIPQPKL